MKDTKVTLRQRIGSWIGWNTPPQETDKFIAPETNTGMPIIAGRQTVPNELGTDALFHTTIQPDIPFKYLEVLQTLASVNPDISYAVENIVQLGNTPYVIDFGDSVSDSEADKMRKVIRDGAKQWYGSINSRSVLVANMLDQLVVNGCLSFESVILQDLTGIDKVVLPNPKHIEFMYDNETLSFEPYQRVSTGIISNSQLIDGDLIKLNTNTYKYFPLRNRSEKPYGIPPFLSAIDMTTTENDVLDNFKQVAKNIGVLGFMSVMVNRPNREKSKDGEWMETDAEFNQRCVNYLNTVIRPEAEKGFNTGMIAGFKQDLEITHQSNNSTNINGAEKFLKELTVIKHAGLKQDPILLGRPFNTSEALGRVILDKFASQVTSYQDIVACGLAELFKLELVLKGFPVMDLSVVFDKPNVKDEKTSEEAQKLKIENGILKYNQGIISQTQLANELDYDTPAQDKPREEVPEPTNNNTPTTEDQNNSMVLSLGGYEDVFEYGTGVCCESHSFAEGDDGNANLDKYIIGYYGAMSRAYKRAVDKISLEIAKRVIRMSKNSSRSEVFDAVYNTILRGWNRDFLSKQKPIIDKWLDAAYKSFRLDKDIFSSDVIEIDGKPTKIPKGVFNQLDFRTLNYMKNTDKFYMGKFITDDDTVNRLQQFIYDEFEKGDLPLGQTDGQRKFITNMSQTLEIEEYKIDRIVRTTTNKMRSYASVNYMQQVGVKQFEVLAMIDNKTSDICRKMNGKVFSVPASRARILKVSKSKPSSVPTMTPFVSSVFKAKDLDQLDNLTGEDLLSTHGIFAPPYHGNCRTQIIAIL
tara:strand:- start:674 stop:3100 length:2427 start_codon:yes stop_codon:yes gene_type:complete